MQVRASGRFALGLATIAGITGTLDRMDQAEAAADVILSNQSVLPQDAMHAKAALALVAVQKGDEATAAEYYSFLLGMRVTLTSSAVSIDRLLGLLSQTIGNPNQASTHFEEALEFCRKAGYKPELAWTCHDYAGTLLERKEEGDRAKSVFLLDEALVISSELGMRPLMGRVTTLREQAETLPVKAPSYPDGLTAREVEVLLLVAVGKSNQDIADELVITLRAAGNHVANILNKTATANRTEAASYAHTHGLITYHDPAGLTRREIEVLQLICGGKTDREIGRELFISVNTVGNHVRNILSKTASANRAEAATYAARHGLVTNVDSTSD